MDGRGFMEVSVLCGNEESEESSGGALDENSGVSEIAACAEKDYRIEADSHLRCKREMVDFADLSRKSPTAEMPCIALPASVVSTAPHT